jgi:hypothetical protein
MLIILVFKEEIAEEQLKYSVIFYYVYEMFLKI